MGRRNSTMINLATIRAFVDQAAEQKVDVVLFPECCISGYWFLRNLSREEIVALAEPVFDGPSSRELVQLAAENKMTIGAGLVEIAPDGTVEQHRVTGKQEMFVYSGIALRPGHDEVLFQRRIVAFAEVWVALPDEVRVELAQEATVGSADEKDTARGFHNFVDLRNGYSACFLAKIRQSVRRV